MAFSRKELRIGRDSMTVYTPWGPIDSATEYGPGVVMYGTASHGGFGLDSARQATMPSGLRAIMPFAGVGFYEEDCDWCIVALAFPDLFKDHELMQAVDTFRTWHKAHAAWLDSTPAKAVVERVAAFAAANAHRFVVTAMCTSGDGWTITARRIDGRQTAQVRDVSGFELPRGGPFDIQLFGDRAIVTDTEFKAVLGAPA